MAAPTFGSISPVEGHPGGRYLVRITGTDFQLADAPPATGYVGGTWSPSMEVEIDGRQASDVRVWSATSLTCVVPAYRRDPDLIQTGLAVDVVLRNLGPPEEEVTEVDGFTFKRTNLARSVPGVVSRITEELIYIFRRQVINNVAISTSVDYDASTGDGLDIAELASTPGVALFGPSYRENKERRFTEHKEDRDVGVLSFDRYREPMVVDLLFDAVAVTRGPGSYGELLELVQELALFFHRNRSIEIDADGSDPGVGTEELEIWLTDGPTMQGTANASDAHSSGLSFEIRGVPIDWDDWLLVESGYLLDDPPVIDLTAEGQ